MKFYKKEKGMEEMTNERVQKLQESWELDKRWKGVTRPYSAEDVIRLRGSIDIEHTLKHTAGRRNFGNRFIQKIILMRSVR